MSWGTIPILDTFSDTMLFLPIHTHNVISTRYMSGPSAPSTWGAIQIEIPVSDLTLYPSVSYSWYNAIATKSHSQCYFYEIYMRAFCPNYMGSIQIWDTCEWINPLPFRVQYLIIMLFVPKHTHNGIPTWYVPHKSFYRQFHRRKKPHIYTWIRTRDLFIQTLTE